MSSTADHTASLSSRLPQVIDGYDLAAETQRARTTIPDVHVLGRTLNRATAVVAYGPEPAHHEETRRRHAANVFANTLDPDSPVLELGWPTSGHFVMDSRGVHIDLVLAVAQRVLDERHPRVVEALARLSDAGLLAHREINTDDYLDRAPHAPGLHLPQDVAELLNGVLATSYPGSGAWRTFFTNSGAESCEAALKLAFMTRYKRFLETHGEARLAEVMRELGIRPFAPLAADTSRKEAVYEDYPFFVAGLERAFHGRTLGALSLTASKKVQKVGFPRLRWVRHIPLNAPAGTLEALVDTRGIDELLRTPGELRRTIDDGRIPRDLFAGFLMEPFQGEGGYRPATPEFAQDCARTCRAHGALFMLDEVQTFARTGTLFFGQQLGVEPDAVSMAKGLFAAALVARADLSRYLHGGWHSNTWGGGRILDVQVGHAVLDTLAHHRDPLFEGRSLPENQMLKGRLLEAGLHELRTRHPGVVDSYVVRGGMARLTVRRRADLVREAWARGLKLLPCGAAGEVSSIRVLLLADVLGREVHAALDVLDAACAALS